MTRSLRLPLVDRCNLLRSQKSRSQGRQTPPTLVADRFVGDWGYWLAGGGWWREGTALEGSEMTAASRSTISGRLLSAFSNPSSSSTGTAPTAPSAAASAVPTDCSESLTSREPESGASEDRKR